MQLCCLKLLVGSSDGTSVVMPPVMCTSLTRHLPAGSYTPCAFTSAGKQCTASETYKLKVSFSDYRAVTRSDSEIVTQREVHQPYKGNLARLGDNMDNKDLHHASA